MILIAITFAVLMVMGLPIGFVILGSSLSYLFFSDIPMTSFVQRIIAGTQSFPLLAVLLFILMGNLMNISGISRRVMDFAYALSAHLTGGLAHVNVLLSTLLAGMSGSTNADAALNAKILVPDMIKRGYSPSFSVAVTATSSLISPMIPPGIGLIMFGFVSNVSIGKLFMGGIIPGLIMMIGEMIVVFIISKKRNYGRDADHFDLRVVVRTFFSALLALVLPLIIIVGIRFGIFTPTEAGGIACLYTFLLGLAYKEINWNNLLQCLKDTAVTTSSIMLILAASSAFSYILTIEQVPQHFAYLLTTITKQPKAMLLLIMLFLLVAGMFIEGTAGIIILGPMFIPIINQLGIDPVHFGIIMVFCMQMGGITPPVGTIMYVVCTIIKVDVNEFIKDSIPFYIALIIICMFLIFFPWMVTWLAYL
jgi:tripartite ATP-independent transporter DctM subunit